jgi:glutaredoxin
MSGPKVRLYVKSEKTVTGTEETEREVFMRQLYTHPDRVKVEGSVPGGTFRVRLFETEAEPRYEFVLSEDQQAIVEMVERIASKHGLEVEVVDVAKESVLRREIQKEFEKVRTFPTLTVSSGEKIEGKITEKEVESILSRIDSASGHSSPR